MSYTPTEWQTDDTVTAEKLNKIENGIADSSKRVTIYIKEVLVEGIHDHYGIFESAESDNKISIEDWTYICNNYSLNEINVLFEANESSDVRPVGAIIEYWQGDASAEPTEAGYIMFLSFQGDYDYRSDLTLAYSEGEDRFS